MHFTHFKAADIYAVGFWKVTLNVSIHLFEQHSAVLSSPARIIKRKLSVSCDMLLSISIGNLIWSHVHQQYK